MKVPLVAKAQMRMLAEGVTDAAPPAATVPDDLRPRRVFTAVQIRSSLPKPGWLRLAGPAGQQATSAPGTEVPRSCRAARARLVQCSPVRLESR